MPDNKKDYIEQQFRNLTEKQTDTSTFEKDDVKNLVHELQQTIIDFKSENNHTKKLIEGDTNKSVNLLQPYLNGIVALVAVLTLLGSLVFTWTNLKGEIVQSKERINTNTEDISALNKEMDSIRDKVENRRAALDQLWRDVISLEDMVERNRDNINDLKR